LSFPRITRFLLLAMAPAAVSLLAQTATPAPKATTPIRRVKTRAYLPPFNPDIILLDPAHGGSDIGGILGSDGEEKNYNLAFATRLEGLLVAQGFTVILTHPDADNDFSADRRVEIANRSKAVACLLLHASVTGHGVHLFTSSLTQFSVADQGRQDSSITPWDSAQAASLPRSLQLANELATALNGQRVPLVVARASVTPIDSFVCPAVAVEIAPATSNRGLSDEVYQQQIASSLVTALGYWRQRAQSQITAEQAAASAAVSASPAAAVPKPKPKPKPATVHSPDEVPLEPDSPVQSAPIVRRPLAQTPPRGTP